MARVTTHRSVQAGGAAIIAAAATIIIAVFNLSIPYFAITPGPAENVLTLIQIRGAKTKPVTGRLLLTTVQLHEIVVAEAIRGWFDTSYEVLPRAAIYPPGQSESEGDRQTAMQMTESQQHAAVAALRFLGFSVKVSEAALVVKVSRHSPAESVLKPGDFIVQLDTVAIKKPADFKAAMKHHKIGDAIAMKVLREGHVLTVRTKTIGRANEAIIGVYLQDVPRVQLPVAVDINAMGIGGPSAGLMYALGIVDLLDASDLTDHRTIAGTGAIGLDGVVEQVGGVRQKIAAARRERADLFIAPIEELRQACATAGNMPVYGVVTLRDAVKILRGAPVAAGRSCR